MGSLGVVLALHFLLSGCPVCGVFNVKKHKKVCFSGILSLYKMPSGIHCLLRKIVFMTICYVCVKKSRASVPPPG